MSKRYVIVSELGKIEDACEVLDQLEETVQAWLDDGATLVGGLNTTTVISNGEQRVLYTQVLLA